MADDWHAVGERRHKCGGRILAYKRHNEAPTLFRDKSPIRCENCGREGEIFAEDGGVDFLWYSQSNELS